MSFGKLCLLEGLRAFHLGIDYGVGKVLLFFIIDKQLLWGEMVGLAVAAYHHDIFINVNCGDSILRRVFEHILSLLLEIYYNDERALGQLCIYLL